ncbi:MAG: alpha,2-mannosidase [Amycolatopsis sp.]|uniref:lectin n=1 Tax=Amycolatopsis sp. TaxID=37632 RepID=UPI0026357E20|nr:lectin [Amycolatopsis sp.]MCU1686645.1 alpha,2-mannosidase [Amycolatopsis sp.]
MVLRALVTRAAAAAILVVATATPLAGVANAATLVSDPASVVNPFVGTSNAADDFPGADAPFGMVQWSPDTPHRPDGGGYEYNDSSITGFSLTHLSGPGCGADGDIPILPTVGAVNTGATDSFSHANESANAGYYSVKTDNGVHTELTATTRSGMAKFTFPATTQANLVFKLNGSQNGDSATSWQVVNNSEVSGSVTSGHFCGAGFTYTAYFDIVFDHPFAKNGTAAATATPKAMVDKMHGAVPAARTVAPNAAAAGPNSGYVTFDTTASQVVQAKVGLSYVSVANAQANRTAENSGWDFGAVQQSTHNAWNSMLGRIQIGGGTTAQQQVFYTALYHSLLHPNVFSDTNGQYPGFDNQVHTVASGHSAQYANFSGWDIYRTQAQLTALIAPTQSSDMAQSMLADYAQGGGLPKWAQNNGETYVMVGDPADPILADYYAFGARNFDTGTALTDMVHEASINGNVRPGVNALNAPGYLPSDGTYQCCNFYGPVSTQLEYDSADFAVSAFAGTQGDTTDQNFFANRAQNWHNTFNSGSGFMQPKLANGSWTGGFNPSSGDNFVEGTSWQYTGMVPFNVAGLATAKGGNAAMISYLNSVLAGFHGANGSQSDLGNEPSLELPWEYDYVGQPYQTQKVVRQVQDQIWTDAPGGLAGNDDLGAMSSWYVFSALGMYPETPGTADLALGSPLFSQEILSLPSGNKLTINAPQAADNAPYVQSATFNGSAWNNAYAPTTAITSGGTLNYTLGTTANTSWATSASAAPPSYAGTANGTKIGTITSALPNDCIDVSTSGTANGTAVQLWTCDQTGAQNWYQAPDGSLQAQGGCLDVSNSGTANGTVVQLWQCNSTGAQQWQKSGSELVNPESGRCLDDPNASTSNGTHLQLYDCNASQAQTWTIHN